MTLKINTIHVYTVVKNCCSDIVFYMVLYYTINWLSILQGIVLYY